MIPPPPPKKIGSPTAIVPQMCKQNIAPRPLYWKILAVDLLRGVLKKLVIFSTKGPPPRLVEKIASGKNYLHVMKLTQYDTGWWTVARRPYKRAQKLESVRYDKITVATLVWIMSIWSDFQRKGDLTWLLKFGFNS